MHTFNIAQHSTTSVKARADTDGVANKAALSAHAVRGDMRGGDITEVAFIVMMEATKSSQEDLKSIMDGLKQINAEKHDAEIDQAAGSMTTNMRHHWPF